MCTYGWVGGWVSSCTDFAFTFTFTLPILSFLSMMGFFVLLVLLLVLLVLRSFLLGTIFKKSPLIILQRKIPGKATKFPEVWSWECALPT